MRTYIIMKKRDLPAAITYPEPYLVVSSLKDARELVDQLNDKSVSNLYWFEHVKNNISCT